MIGFGYLYNKDRDKRKLMFLLAFFLIWLKHSSSLIGWWHNDLVTNNVTDWAPFPMLCAFLIAPLCSIFKRINFDVLFKGYLIAFFATVVLMFAPFPSDSLTVIIVPIFSTSVVVVSIVSTVINRQLPNLFFLGSIFCIVGVEIFKNVVESPDIFLIFWYVLSHVFLFLVFITSRNHNSDDISSFFSLQERLEFTRKELETSKQRLVKVENIFAASPNPILVVDLNGKIVDYNLATRKLYGFTDKHEINGKHYSDFIANKDRVKFQNLFNTVLDVGTIANVEFLAVNKKGIIFPAEISASIIKNSLGTQTGFVIITEDISERKMMENELRRHTEELGELVEERTKALKESQEKLVKSERLAAIGQAATMVGHDLRNPLQAIENGVYILKKSMSKSDLPENVKKTIQAINTAVEYADNIVKNLQSFTKIKQPIFKKTDVNSLIQETFSLVNKPNNVAIIFEPECLPKIDLDADMIRRVFVNLASNAIQAMNSNGGTLTVVAKKLGDFVKISFKDTGVGLSEATKKRLFTAFFTTKAQGMGVGLAVCKRFIELHLGTIEVESTEGNGAEFTVTLPIKQVYLH